MFILGIFGRDPTFKCSAPVAGWWLSLLMSSKMRSLARSIVTAGGQGGDCQTNKHQ